MEQNILYPITQEEYKKIKEKNKIILEILLEYVEMIKKEIQDYYEENGGSIYVTKAYEMLRKMNNEFYKNYIKFEIILKMNQTTEKVEENGKEKIIRYYLKDVYSAIIEPVKKQNETLKRFSKKILRSFAIPKYHKRFVKEREIIKRKLQQNG